MKLFFVIDRNYDMVDYIGVAPSAEALEGFDEYKYIDQEVHEIHEVWDFKETFYYSEPYLLHLGYDQVTVSPLLQSEYTSSKGLAVRLDNDVRYYEGDAKTKILDKLIPETGGYARPVHDPSVLAEFKEVLVFPNKVYCSCFDSDICFSVLK